MKLEVGKKYITNAFEIIGPMERYSDTLLKSPNDGNENVRLWSKESGERPHNTPLSPDTVMAEYEGKDMNNHNYEEGRWYSWDGKEKCPLNPKDKCITLGIDSSSNGYWDFNPEKATTHRKGVSGTWDWVGKSSNGKGNLWGHHSIVAFYIIKKYKEPETVEMTVEEISEALGKNVKVIKKP